MEWSCRVAARHTLHLSVGKQSILLIVSLHFLAFHLFLFAISILFFALNSDGNGFVLHTFLPAFAFQRQRSKNFALNTTSTSHMNNSISLLLLLLSQTRSAPTRNALAAIEMEKEKKTAEWMENGNENRTRLMDVEGNGGQQKQQNTGSRQRMKNLKKMPIHYGNTQTRGRRRNEQRISIKTIEWKLFNAPTLFPRSNVTCGALVPVPVHAIPHTPILMQFVHSFN